MLSIEQIAGLVVAISVIVYVGFGLTDWVIGYPKLATFVSNYAPAGLIIVGTTFPFLLLFGSIPLWAAGTLYGSAMTAIFLFAVTGACSMARFYRTDHDGRDWINQPLLTLDLLNKLVLAFWFVSAANHPLGTNVGQSFWLALAVTLLIGVIAGIVMWATDDCIEDILLAFSGFCHIIFVGMALFYTLANSAQIIGGFVSSDYNGSSIACVTMIATYALISAVRFILGNSAHQRFIENRQLLLDVKARQFNMNNPHW